MIYPALTMAHLAASHPRAYRQVVAEFDSWAALSDYDHMDPPPSTRLGAIFGTYEFWVDGTGTLKSATLDQTWWGWWDPTLGEWRDG